MEVEKKFYDSKYNPTNYYAIVEEHGLIRRRYHNSQYDLSNDAETTGQVLITQPVKRQTKEALQTIEYLGAK